MIYIQTHTYEINRYVLNKYRCGYFTVYSFWPSEVRQKASCGP